MNDRKIRHILAIGWTILLMGLCMMPMRGLGIQGDDSRLFRIPHLDKIAHVAMFFGFAFLWVRASESRSRGLIVLAAGLILAVATEYVQSLPIIGRDGDLADGLADMVGALAGVAFGCLKRPATAPIPRPEPTV